MAQKLEATKRGGGSTSIRVGTMGTIGSLMNRELSSTSRTLTPSSSSKALPFSPSLKQRKSMDKTSTSNMASTTGIKHRSPENNITGRALGATTVAKRQKQKVSPPQEGRSGNRRSPPELLSKITRSRKRAAYQIPMLGSDNISLDGTSIREKKPGKKGINMVEVVDVHCGGISGGALSNRLKKLGFSKLSQSMI